MYRNNSYDEDLAKEFLNLIFAKEYFLGLIEDEDEVLGLVEALRLVIPKMGVSEYCELVGKVKAILINFCEVREILSQKNLMII